MPRSTSHLKLVSSSTDPFAKSAKTTPRIGRVLLLKGWVTEGDLLKAWSIQRYEAARIGEILVGMGKITPAQLYNALGELHDLQLVDLQNQPPLTNWVDFSSPQTSLQQGYIVWRDTGLCLTIALSDPSKMDALRHRFQTPHKPVDFVLVTPENLQAFIATNQRRFLQQAAVTCCPKSMSCRSTSWGLRANLWGLVMIISVIILLTINPLIVLVASLCFVFIALILLMGFRLACLRSLQKPDEPDVDRKFTLKPMKRPKVSILVPLFHESAILERLVDRLQALAYPAELLEICFIYEEKDLKTKATLEGMTLPVQMKVVEVPHGKIQTKPRAMNYALDFCSGSIIGIYDAEDAPEIDQVERVVEKFAAEGENVACIQCILDFYNSGTNWMSRCFTVEYAILFRLILPALDRMKLPIPLGGTSVFFRRDILQKLGRWDVYNVTEDADLGYRLFQMGYRCSWINAVTYEEANYRFVPWIKQRSRWLKGFFMTAVLHFRNPVNLQKKIGTRAVLTMLALTVVPWVLCPMAPIILPMWLLSFGIDLPYYSSLPLWFINTLIITFVSTELMSLYLAYRITKTDQHKHLRVWLLTTILYWPIAFLSSFKALFEVVFRPAYWDKSEHGLNDHLYTVQITELTGNQRIKG